MVTSRRRLIAAAASAAAMASASVVESDGPRRSLASELARSVLADEIEAVRAEGGAGRRLRGSPALRSLLGDGDVGPHEEERGGRELSLWSDWLFGRNQQSTPTKRPVSEPSGLLPDEQPKTPQPTNNRKPTKRPSKKNWKKTKPPTKPPTAKPVATTSTTTTTTTTVLPMDRDVTTEGPQPKPTDLIQGDDGGADATAAPPMTVSSTISCTRRSLIKFDRPF